MDKLSVYILTWPSIILNEIGMSEILLHSPLRRRLGLFTFTPAEKTLEKTDDF